jgi:hypothetical protein
MKENRRHHHYCSLQNPKTSPSIGTFLLQNKHRSELNKTRLSSLRRLTKENRRHHYCCLITTPRELSLHRYDTITNHQTQIWTKYNQIYVSEATAWKNRRHHHRCSFTALREISIRRYDTAIYTVNIVLELNTIRFKYRTLLRELYDNIRRYYNYSLLA